MMLLDADRIRLNAILRCPECDGHLQVSGISPVGLGVFRTHELAMADVSFLASSDYHPGRGASGKGLVCA
ncbi:MAG: hypothetical protein WBC63_07535 [Candidatus Bipolaricaulia bacterium]